MARLCAMAAPQGKRCHQRACNLFGVGRKCSHETDRYARGSIQLWAGAHRLTGIRRPGHRLTGITVWLISRASLGLTHCLVLARIPCLSKAWRGPTASGGAPQAKRRQQKKDESRRRQFRCGLRYSGVGDTGNKQFLPFAPRVGWGAQATFRPQVVCRGSGWNTPAQVTGAQTEGTRAASGEDGRRQFGG